MSELKPKQDTRLAQDQATENGKDHAKPDMPLPRKGTKPRRAKPVSALERGRSHTKH